MARVELHLAGYIGDHQVRPQRSTMKADRCIVSVGLYIPSYLRDLALRARWRGRGEPFEAARSVFVLPCASLRCAASSARVCTLVFASSSASATMGRSPTAVGPFTIWPASFSAHD